MSKTKVESLGKEQEKKHTVSLPGNVSLLLSANERRPSWKGGKSKGESESALQRACASRGKITAGRGKEEKSGARLPSSGHAELPPHLRLVRTAGLLFAGLFAGCPLLGCGWEQGGNLVLNDWLLWLVSASEWFFFLFLPQLQYHLSLIKEDVTKIPSNRPTIVHSREFCVSHWECLSLYS